MRKCRSGFTLVELLIVMGIVILFITMAVPSIRVLTGSRSLSVSQNQLAAVLTRAREDAIALQDIRGVLFYLDPSSGRVGAAIVQQAVVTDTTNVQFNTVLLDTLPGNDSLLLPVGVRIQTVFNGMDATAQPLTTTTTAWQKAIAARAKMSANQMDDRYLGFNPIQGASVPGTNVQFWVGGCILFDGTGRLISRPYGFQMSAYTTSSTTYPQGVMPSNLCKLMGFGVNTNGPPSNSNPWMLPTSAQNPTFYNSSSHSAVYMPGCPSGMSNGFPNVPLMSQLGLVMFDYDSFKTLGFTDVDSDVAPTGSGASYTGPWAVGAPQNGDGIHSESDEENWLDSNSTPIMINRFNGTLIRGE